MYLQQLHLNAFLLCGLRMYHIVISKTILFLGERQEIVSNNQVLRVTGQYTIELVFLKPTFCILKSIFQWSNAKTSKLIQNPLFTSPQVETLKQPEPGKSYNQLPPTQLTTPDRTCQQPCSADLQHDHKAIPNEPPEEQSTTQILQSLSQPTKFEPDGLPTDKIGTQIFDIQIDPLTEPDQQPLDKPNQNDANGQYYSQQQPQSLNYTFLNYLKEGTHLNIQIQYKHRKRKFRVKHKTTGKRIRNTEIRKHKQRHKVRMKVYHSQPPSIIKHERPQVHLLRKGRYKQKKRGHERHLTTPIEPPP